MRKIFQAIWNRPRFEADLSDELQSHLEERAADLEKSGLTKSEALRRARLEMGPPEHYKEACREARGLRWLDECRLDLLYAIRGLRRNKVFATIAILTLALGIGANAAIFALVNSVLLKTLSVPNPEQLQAVYWTLPQGSKTFHRNASGRSMREGTLRIADMFAYQHFSRLRTDLAPKADLFGHMGLGRIGIAINGQAQLARGLAASWNYFPALGVTPYLGRVFIPDDESPGVLSPAVLITHQFWSTAFAGDPSIVGQTLTVADRKAVITGVLPPDFRGISPGEVFDIVVTLTAWDDISQARKAADPRAWWVRLMARLQPGLAPSQFQSEIETRLVALLHAEPVRDRFDPPRIRLIEGARGLHWLRSEIEQPLRLVMSVALLILLMAAVNVGGLMLARSEARMPETGARLSLGASRLRVVRQHLIESLLIAVLGLIGGLLLAVLIGGVVLSLLARGGEAPALDLTPDVRFIAVATLTTIAIAFLFGVYPAWKSSRLELTAVLKRAHSARIARLPMGRLLVAAQVSLSLVLLIAAATFLRTVVNLRSLSLGFVPERLLLFKADPALAGYRDDRLFRFYEQALERLASAPGVRSVSLSRYGLLQGGASSSGFFYRDPNGQFKPLGELRIHSVSANYFDTVGVPLLAGRDVRGSDTAKTQHVILVNQKLARLIRPDGGSPIGLSLYETVEGRNPAEIIGVTGDAKYNEIRGEIPPTLYAPYAQTAIRGATFSIRSHGDPSSLAATVRQVMRTVDPGVPIFDLRTQEEQISIAIERERILAKLLAGFGTLALLLAAIGIYGVLSYSITRRTSEIGIRLALGAAPRTLRVMIIRESMPQIFIGGALGLCGAWWFTKLLEGFLFGINPMDTASVIAAVAALSLAAVIAILIPARRAARVTPMQALRYE